MPRQTTRLSYNLIGVVLMLDEPATACTCFASLANSLAWMYHATTRDFCVCSGQQWNVRLNKHHSYDTVEANSVASKARHVLVHGSHSSDDSLRCGCIGDQLAESLFLYAIFSTSRREFWRIVRTNFTFICTDTHGQHFLFSTARKLLAFGETWRLSVTEPDVEYRRDYLFGNETK